MQFRFRNFQISIPYPLLLLLIAMLAYWQLTFFQNTLKWDVHDVMLAWRYHAQQDFSDGKIPLWNPYQQFGYPFFADLQYSSWNVESFLLSTINAYEYYTLPLIVIFYVWMCGYGMYRCALFFCERSEVAFFLALCYMLSGCVTHHMQQFVVVMGMAWLPFLFWQFNAFLKDLQFVNVLGTALFLALLMTTGYQALFFMLFYVMLILAIIKFVRLFKEKNKQLIGRFLIYGVSLVIISVFLLLPVLVAKWQTAPFVERMSSGVSLQEAQFSPFTVQSFTSVLVPSTSTFFHFTQTDQTCASIFAGLLFPVFLIFSFTKRLSVAQVVLLFFSVLFLLASLGDIIPIRSFLYHYVPLMNLFRIPALFRIVALFLLLIQIAVYFKESTPSPSAMRLVYLTLTMVYAGIAFVIYSVASVSFDLQVGSFFDWTERVNLNEIAFSQSVVFSFISFIGFAVYSLKESPKFSLNFLTVIPVFLISVQFNIHKSVLSEFSPSYLNRWIVSLPEGNPLPSSASVYETSINSPANSILGVNTGNYHKKLLPDEFTSFHLDAYRRISDNKLHTKQRLLELPFYYYSEVTNDNNTLSGKNVPVFCELFKTDELQFRLNAPQRGFLNLMQADFPGWTVQVNGKPSSIESNFGLCMRVAVEKGINTVHFKYVNKVFSYAWWIYLCGVLIVSVLFLFCSGHRVLAYVVFLIFISALLAFITRKQGNPALDSELLKRIAKQPNVLVVSRMIPDAQASGIIHSDRTDNFKRALMSMREYAGNEFYLIWENDQRPVFYFNALTDAVGKAEKLFLSSDLRFGFYRFRKSQHDDDFIKIADVNSARDSSFFRTMDTVEHFFGKEKVFRAAIINRYGPNFDADYKLFTAGRREGGINFRFKFLCTANARATFYVRFKDKSGDLRWTRSFPLERWMLKSLEWNEVFLSIVPDIKVKDQERIEAFVMNASNEVIYLKDFTAVSFEAREE